MHLSQQANNKLMNEFKRVIPSLNITYVPSTSKLKRHYLLSYYSLHLGWIRLITQFA